MRLSGQCEWRWALYQNYSRECYYLNMSVISSYKLAKKLNPSTRYIYITIKINVFLTIKQGEDYYELIKLQIII